jgi:hypothetical protein
MIRHMKRAPLGAVVLLSLALPATAFAKGLTERLQLFPSHPRVGRVVTLQLRPYEIRQGFPPALVAPDFDWHVSAYSPSGRSFPVRFRRSAGDPYLWSASFRFRSRGHWLISVVDNPPNGLTIDVHVWRGRPSVWERLDRPFAVPSVPAGGPCPTSAPDPRGDLSRIGFAGTAWGPGPVYPAGLGDGTPVLNYAYPPPPDSGWGDWGGNKVNWLRDLTAYAGPVLIHGFELDGPNELGFGNGFLPARSMRARSRTTPSYTRPAGDGCYAYQVDGLGFSYPIVFEARSVPQ